MPAFFNDDSLKQEYVDRVSQHQEMDEIIQGRYWEHGKGCALGCTLHQKGQIEEKGTTIHEAFETKLNIPVWLGRSEEVIFEHCTSDYAKTFPLRFLNSIPVGFDDWRSFYNDVCVFLYENVSSPSYFPNKICELLTRTINYHKGIRTDINNLREFRSSIPMYDMDATYSLYRAIGISLFNYNLPSLIIPVLHSRYEADRNSKLDTPYYYNELFEELGNYMIEWFNNYIKSVEPELEKEITCLI